MDNMVRGRKFVRPGNLCVPESDYAFPTISADGPVISATRLGHPLIPHAQKIANDVTVDKVGEILPSGSNMAGAHFCAPSG